MSSKRVLQQTIGLAIVVVLMIGCGGSAEPTPTSTPIPPTSTPVPPTPTPVLKGRVDIGGYELFINCKGDGSPTVILDAGLNAVGAVSWYIVRSKIETLTRACFYDRAGVGQSDQPLMQPRTNQDMVDDLHALLTNADIPGPYVLVAHSMAGFTARLYANQYPQDVVGMVLVDSSHPDQIARWLALLPPESPDESEAVKKLRQDWVADVDPLEMPERWDMETSTAQVRATGSLGSIPLVVLTQDVNDLERVMRELKRGYGSDFPPELAESQGQEWLRMQQELTELSSNGTHTIVEGSSHMIPQEEPEAVIDAILQVVEAVRGE